MKTMSSIKCFNCMKSGHKTYQCPKEENDWEIYNFDIDDFMCSRCGRSNHHTNECYASRDIFGNYLIDNGKRCPYRKRHMRTSNGIYKSIIKKNTKM